MENRNIIVLAAGPSVADYNIRGLEERGLLIAVNGAGLYTKPDVAFTMDRLVAELCVPVWRVQGVPSIWVREGIGKNFSTDGLMQFKHDGNCPTHMTLAAGYLNGSNSGTCALNLAYQIASAGGKRVFLLGFDMKRGDKPTHIAYWYPPYAWNTYGSAKDGKLREWAREFEDISKQFELNQIEVFNVNHRSAIESFPQISYAKFKEMTK